MIRFGHPPLPEPAATPPDAPPPRTPDRPSRTAPERFELPIKVHEADIDQLGHVNNVVYLKWVQDVATAHWRAVATREQQAALAWVVIRHEIDYSSAARLGEDIVAETWVGMASRRTFERHTEIRRMPDRKLLARARTLWCPIDVGSGKPARVDAEVRARFSVASTD